MAIERQFELNIAREWRWKKRLCSRRPGKITIVRMRFIWKELSALILLICFGVSYGMLDTFYTFRNIHERFPVRLPSVLCKAHPPYLGCTNVRASKSMYSSADSIKYRKRINKLTLLFSCHMIHPHIWIIGSIVLFSDRLEIINRRL